VTERRPARRRLTQTQRREESTLRLHRAFAELVSTQGYIRTTASEIGEHAGYSRNMVRDRFGSKQDLFFDFTIAAILEQQQRSEAAPGTGMERVLRIVEDVRARAEHAPMDQQAAYTIALESAVAGHPLSALVLAGIGDQIDYLTRSIAEGTTDGSIRPDVDPRTEAERVMAVGMGLAFEHVSGVSGLSPLALVDLWRSAALDRLAPTADGPAAEEEEEEEEEEAG
jgi:AcrR family transcriptional regulator